MNIPEGKVRIICDGDVHKTKIIMPDGSLFPYATDCTIKLNAEKQVAEATITFINFDTDITVPEPTFVEKKPNESTN